MLRSKAPSAVNVVHDRVTFISLEESSLMELQTNSIHMPICIDTRHQGTNGAGSSHPKGKLFTPMQVVVLATLCQGWLIKWQSLRVGAVFNSGHSGSSMAATQALHSSLHQSRSPIVSCQFAFTSAHRAVLKLMLVVLHHRVLCRTNDWGTCLPVTVSSVNPRVHIETRAGLL